MADIIADLAVRIGAVVSPYNAALADAAVNGERFTALQMANADAIREANRQTAAGLNTVKMAAEAVGVAVAASAAEDLKWATQFQTQVTRLYTQAGLSAKQLADAHLTTDGLKKELLQLGDDAGFAGDQVAAALYYPISSGIALAQALAMVDQAERASRISGAALTDTTIALTSVMRGYGASLSDPAKAMAEINAIVGQGMMVFGDFNTSVKGWEPTAATLKVDLMSAGAALDFLTDRGDTAATAGTRVSMMLAMMVGQTKQAAKFTTELGLTTTDAMSAQSAFNKVLKDSGLTVSELADDLQKPDGIFVALSHLRSAMNDHGMSEDAQNALLTKLFGGGKSFRGVAELTTQLDQLQVKYQQITTQANGDAWQQAWTTNSATLGQQLDVIGARFHNIGIEVGDFMIPKVSQGIAWLESHGAAAWQKFWGGLTNTSLPTQASSPFAPGSDHTGTPLAASPDDSNWRKAGDAVREVADDVAAFAVDVRGAAAVVLPILLDLGSSVASVIGHDLLIGAHALVDVIGPGIAWFAGLVQDHQGVFEFFIEGVLGGIAVKWAVLTGLKAVSAIGDLAAGIIGFPLRQTGQIGEAFAGVRASWASVAEESTALGSAVSGSFTAVYRPVVNTTEAVSRYVQISTGQLDPAMIATARATQVSALAFRELASETALAARAEADAAARRAVFLADAVSASDGVSKATQKAMQAEAQAAQINAEKLGVYAAMAEEEAQAAAVQAEQAAARVATAEGGFKASTVAMAADAEGAEVAGAGLMAGIGAGLPIIGGVIAGIDLLGMSFLSTSDDAKTASVSVDQFTAAMLQSRQGLSDTSSSLGQAVVDLKAFDDWQLTASHAGDKFEGKYLIDMADGLGQLKLALPTTIDPMVKLGVVLGKLNQEYGAGKQTLSSYDGALAQMVTSGHADRAAALIDQIRAVTDAHGQAMINADRDFPQYYQALARVNAEQLLGIGATDGATAAITGLDGAITDTGDDATRAKAAYQQMTDVIAKTQSVDALQRQFNDLNDTLKRNAEEFHGSARDITSNSDAAIANRDAIRQMATAILDMHDKEANAAGDIKGANKAMADQVVQLEQVAVNAGLSRDQIDTLLKKYGLIPPELDTKFKIDSTSLDNALDKISQIEGKTGGGYHMKLTPMFADGGWVTGMLGSAVPAIVHAGEYVLSREMLAGRAPIDPRALAMLAAPRGGPLPAMAGGGAAYGPPTIVVPVTVQGALLSTETAVQQAVIAAMTRFGLRNPASYPAYSSARRRGS